MSVEVLGGLKPASHRIWESPVHFWQRSLSVMTWLFHTVDTSQLAAEEERPHQGLTPTQASSWGMQELLRAKRKQDQQGWDEQRLRLAPLWGEQYNSISPPSYKQCQKCSCWYKLLFILIFCRCSIIFLLSSITTVLNKDGTAPLLTSCVRPCMETCRWSHWGDFLHGDFVPLGSEHGPRPNISNCVGNAVMMAYLLPQCWVYSYPFLTCMHSRWKKRQGSAGILHVKVDNKKMKKILFPW